MKAPAPEAASVQMGLIPIDRGYSRICRHTLSWSNHNFSTSFECILAQIIEKIVHHRFSKLGELDRAAFRIEVAGNDAIRFDQ